MEPGRLGRGERGPVDPGGRQCRLARAGLGMANANERIGPIVTASAWFKRFGLHLAAAVGATGIFVAAATVGASQTRQQVASVAPAEVVSVTATARPPRPP